MKRKIYILLAICIGIGLFLTKHYTMLLDQKDSAIVVNKQYTYNEDYQDKRKLSRAVDNIFIGEVVKKNGNKEYTGEPNTQFSIRITQNIKGALLGDIIVNQLGGYYKENGKLYLLSYEKDHLLKEGQMYLFAVSSTKKDYYTMLPKYGHTPLDNEKEKLNLIDQFRKVMEQ
ncbi:MAG TPA: hypothetical protein VJ558_06510 [Bacillales bacterium]|nr:hypothetical protein [Bacillales bacterium]